MIKRLQAFSFTVFAILTLTCTFFLPVQYAHAETVITDEAFLFTDDELAELTGKCDLIYDRHQVDVYIMTRTSLPNGQYFINYMEDYADAMEVTDAILLLINMDPSGRVYEIEGYGKAETYLNENRCGKVLDSMQNDMRSGNYFDAVMTGLDKTNVYLGTKDSALADAVIDSPLFKSYVHLIIALIVAGCIVGIWVYQSGGTMSVGAFTYMNQNSSRLLARHDHYIRTTTTKTRKPESSGSGGRGGSGVSSGGRSHSGGGGRSF